jgi:plasmid stabilization system protein ParE
MAFKVVWADVAFANLEAIVSYLSQTSPDTAEKVGTAVLDHIEILKSFPRIGPRYPKDPRGRIREITSGKYRVLYRIDEPRSVVEIVTSWHSSGDEPELS